MPRGNLRKYDLNLLVALDALLRTRNVTRAAEQLCLTQSAMSSELRRLRKMFGDELLVRNGRENALTTLAEDLKEPVAEILAHVERTLEYQPDFDPGTEPRHFSVVMTDYTSLMLLHPLLQHAAKEAPGTGISVFPFNSTIERMLTQDGVDLVVAPTFDLEGIPSRKLFSERYVCVVSADHPDVGDELTEEQFATLPRLTVAWRARPLPRPRVRSTTSPMLGSVWRASSLAERGDPQPVDENEAPRTEVTMENFTVAPFLVSGTRLVGVLPERLANRFRDVAGLRVLQPPVPLPVLEETMYWSPVWENDPAHIWLRETMVSVAREID